MNIKDLKESLPYLFKAELTGFIWGHAGVGKTTAVKQYAEEMGYKFFPFYLGTQSDLGDILGLAEFVDNGDGTKSTTFAVPKWLHDTVKYCNENPESGAIIFLDEFNRARRDILNGMFSLALDKTFHTVKLPKNCHIIAAGNPPTDNYFVTDVDETALMSRFVHIKLEPTVQEWLEYAKTKTFESSLVGFIQEQPGLLEATHPDFQLPVKPDRRAYERLSRLFEIHTPTHILDQLMAGIIGIERTVAYKQYLKESDKPLTAEEVLNHKKPELIEKWSQPGNIQASFLDITRQNVIDEMLKRDKENKVLNASEKSNLMWFISTVPKDISYVLITTLGKRMSPIFRDFSTDGLYAQQLIDLFKTAKGKDLGK